MKIKFNQPKYILPVILLPFIFLFNYFAMGFLSKEEKGVVLEKQENIITSVPKPNMEKLNINSKLENMKKNFKNYEDLSALSGNLIDENENDINANVGESVYTDEEAKNIIKLQDSLKQLKEATRLKEDSFKAVLSNPNSNNVVKKKSNNNSSNRNISNSQREFNDFENQRYNLEKKKVKTAEQEFAEQMRKIDSIMYPDRYKTEDLALDDVKKLSVQKVKQIYQVKTSKNYNEAYFNSISVEDENDSKIEGLLDQQITVYQGSRVRIKLQGDILIDSIRTKKNQYIFGEVTGFSAQRLYIDITNILVKGKIYDVQMSVYDLDGMRGLYVPSSKFREFSKNLGSETADNVGSSTSQTSGEQTTTQQIITGISTAVTKATSAFIKKNRAHLKYNTNIYLINNKTN